MGPGGFGGAGSKRPPVGGGRHSLGQPQFTRRLLPPDDRGI